MRISHEFRSYFPIYFAGLLLFLISCSDDTQLVSPDTLPLGEITYHTIPDTCGHGKCYPFTSSSTMVAEDKTGLLKIDEPPRETIGTVVMYSGGRGVNLIDRHSRGKQIIDDALEKGYRIIQVKWNEGWFDGSDQREGFRKLAVHPASITQYIFDNLVDQEQPLILFGGSGGAAQIAYMLSFYGIGDVADKAIVFAGFWMGRLDIGCYNEDPMYSHLDYSERARAALDRSMGYYPPDIGPCASRDTSFQDAFKNASISHGGQYHYPTTQLYLIYGGNDQVGALNQGLTYYKQVAAAQSPHLYMQVIEGAGHGLLGDSIGNIVLRNALFDETIVLR